MGEEFGDHKRYDFFVKNLLGIDPAWAYRHRKRYMCLRTCSRWT